MLLLFIILLQITKQEVDSFKPGQQIPTCQLLVEWTENETVRPVNLTFTVDLKGASEPINYFRIDLTPIIPGTVCHIPNTQSCSMSVYYEITAWLPISAEQQTTVLGKHHQQQEQNGKVYHGLMMSIKYALFCMQEVHLRGGE